jgi:hypothetical protein
MLGGSQASESWSWVKTSTFSDSEAAGRDKKGRREREKEGAITLQREEAPLANEWRGRERGKGQNGKKG